jgi:outer membrane protein TolC
LLIAGLTAGPAAAQRTDYSKGVSAFPNVFAPYEGVKVPEPNFANSGRLEQITRDGKLYLSLSDAIALALENNLDLAIQRYNLGIADTDILRTKAGSGVRGVSTGIVTGTPGGSATTGAGASGSGAGGTSTGAGGAGAGSSGIVSSTAGTGTAVDSFDPSLSSTMAIEHATTPLSNTITSGVNVAQQNTGTANYTYNQAFPTGTAFSVGFSNNRITSNSTRNLLVPSLSSGLRLSFRQHLTAGFGLQPNMRFIRTAKNNKEISDVAFRQQVMSTTSQIQNIYWDLVNAYEDVKVKQRSLALAQKTEADNRKQVEIGTLAPIEVVRAQAEVASRNQDLIISQTTLTLQQLLMKNAITKNQSDAVIAAAEVIPTDTMVVSATEDIVPIQDLVAAALQRRPELVQSRIDLQNRDITKKSARNAMLPTVDLVGFYGTSALAGALNPNLQAGLTTGGLTTTGYGSALSTLFGGDFPDYQVGFNLTIPFRNRAAQADQIRSELEYRQAQTRLQQQQNQISVEVRNAQVAVTQNRARVEAAEKQRELQAQSLDAENKKYALGASTNILVLQAQRDLAQAESNLVSVKVAYEKSRVELDRVTANTLDRLGLSIQDAETGNVQHMPTVQGVQPRNDLTVQPPGSGATMPPATQPPAAQPPAPRAQTNTTAPPELQLK